MVTTRSLATSRWPGEDGLYEVRDRRLADPPEGQGGHGDPDLADGEVRVQVAQGLAHHAGPGAPLLLQLHDARLAHAHQGELRGHEERVEAHQDEGQQEV